MSELKVQILVLPFASCVTLDKLTNLSVSLSSVLCKME